MAFFFSTAAERKGNHLIQGLVSSSQDQILVLTVLYVPSSLDSRYSGYGARNGQAVSSERGGL
jgi:hypothetical protein